MRNGSKVKNKQAPSSMEARIDRPEAPIPDREWNKMNASGTS